MNTTRIERIAGKQNMERQDSFDKNALVMVSDPVPDVLAEDMKDIIAHIDTEQGLADTFAKVSNKFWWIEDDLYDFDPGTEDYARACAVVDEWGALMHSLSDRIKAIMERDNLLIAVEKGKPHPNIHEPFMKKYGYRDGRGWWIREKD